MAVHARHARRQWCLRTAGAVRPCLGRFLRHLSHARSRGSTLPPESGIPTEDISSRRSSPSNSFSTSTSPGRPSAQCAAIGPIMAGAANRSQQGEPEMVKQPHPPLGAPELRTAVADMVTTCEKLLATSRPADPQTLTELRRRACELADLANEVTQHDSACGRSRRVRCRCSGAERGAEWIIDHFR